jgi:hypothetical protein
MAKLSPAALPPALTAMQQLPTTLTRPDSRQHRVAVLLVMTWATSASINNRFLSLAHQAACSVAISLSALRLRQAVSSVDSTSGLPLSSHLGERRFRPSTRYR